MYFKLSLRNMRRSFKDYTIYFLTLIFSISLFYISNSIESQKVLLDLSDASKNAFLIVSKIMSVASKFIAIVVGFLIIYANNYLYKRRKKEFGVYMLLGMEKRDISKIIYLENIIIGFMSLVLGVIIGIIGSHLLSLFTASLFEVSLKEFVFIFSKEACIKTVISFAIIYIIIAIFNSKSIKGVKLITLLKAEKKNEKIKIENTFVSIAIFLLSLVCIGTAYYIVLDSGIASIDKNLARSVILGILGTFLLFMSLSKFLLKLFQINKKVYLKDINMFVLRQVSSKINTAFISMSCISLMIFVSICSLSAGLLINKGLSKDLDDLTHHDLTVYDYLGSDFYKYFKDSNFDFNKYCSDYHYYNIYSSDIRYSDLLNEDLMESLKNYYPIKENVNIPVMKLSDLNKELNMIGKESISLKNDEYLITSDIGDMIQKLKEITKDNVAITINNKNLKSKDKIVSDTFNGTLMKSNLCTLVVNDEIVSGFNPGNTFLNIEVNKESGLSIGEVEDIISELQSNCKDGEFYFISRDEIISNSRGLGISVAYLALYLGITFIIAAAAILAIQQLSESDNNIERYNLLRNIGVDEKTINKSVFMQIGIYFILPLIVSIIHSVVGLKVSKNVVVLFSSKSSMSDLIIISSLFIVVIYGGYFLATYLGAKNIIKARN